MKLVEGRTLAALLGERNGPGEDLPRFVAAFEHVCQAVGFAHARRVVHRDLKPANVMVGAFGEVQVVDWGLAREGPREETESHAASSRAEPCDGADGTADCRSSGTDDRTRSGMAMGTPTHMPPEQARGEWDKVGSRSDVFGLGAILCAVPTGKPPHTGASTAEVLRRSAAGDLSAALERLDGCGADAALIDLVGRCLALDPEDRPVDGRAVAGEREPESRV